MARRTCDCGECRRSIQREIIFRLFAGDLPKHVTKAITEVEDKLTADVREATGRDVTVEFDLTPTTPRAPGKCQYDTPVGTKCKMCGQVHKA